MSFLDRGPTVTDSASLSYEQVCAVGEPSSPLPEVHQPVISRGESNFEGMVEPYGGQEPFFEELFLARATDPTQAYSLMGKPSRPLDHHAPGWGEIQYAFALPRVGQTSAGFSTFFAPPPNQAFRVAIKKLNKAVVSQYLAMGGHENPYKEISRMQELGDGIHVLECLEALEDDTFLYIVMPYCHEGSLLENIPWQTGYPHQEARALFRNVLEDLLYLERHGIFHHDIAPDNFLFYRGRLVLFDFAMSLRIPRESNGQRYLIHPHGTTGYGTFACQAPEVFFRQCPYDGVAADLWAAAVILYSLLTGYPLYRVPHPSDILFRYYILAGGLKPGLNEDAVEVMEDAFGGGNEAEQDNLLARAMANLAVPPDALEVLTNLLHLSPAARWSLMQTIESPWVQGNLG